jgi:hypothetical protein
MGFHFDDKIVQFSQNLHISQNLFSNFFLAAPFADTFFIHNLHSDEIRNVKVITSFSASCK